MKGQEKIEAYLSSVRHDLRSQLMVVREGASMILDGIGDSNCETCFSLLRPALESTDELNKLIGELINISKINAILPPVLGNEEELKRIKKELLDKEEELKTIKKELWGKNEELRSIKKELLAREEELKGVKKEGLKREEELKILRKDLLGKNEELKVIKNELVGKDEESRQLKKELLQKEEELRQIKKELHQRKEDSKGIEKDSIENELEILKYELMGMISHSVRTPLAVMKESLSLVLDEIPGKLSPKQRELLLNGKKHADELIQSVEEIFQKSWNEIIHSARKQFPPEALPKKDRGTIPKKRILIVEDQAVIVEMLKMRLEANHYEVITAGDGEEGLEKAKNENPSLIILDVMLPKMNGYKICQLLKEDPKYNKIPIIISSGRTPQEIKRVGQEVGADAYIPKPFEAEVLLSKIRELLEKNGRVK